MTDHWRLAKMSMATLFLAMQIPAASAQDLYEQYQIEVLANTKSVEILVHDEVDGGCWKTPSYAKTTMEKRLLSNGVSISEGSLVKIDISGVGFANSVGARKVGCAVYLSVEATYFMFVPTPLRGKTVLGQVKFFERGSLFAGGDIDNRIASTIQQWSDELSVIWLKGRQK